MVPAEPLRFRHLISKVGGSPWPRFLFCFVFFLSSTSISEAHVNHSNTGIQFAGVLFACCFSRELIRTLTNVFVFQQLRERGA